MRILKDAAKGWLNAGLGLLYPEVCQLCGRTRATPAEGYVCGNCRAQPHGRLTAKCGDLDAPTLHTHHPAGPEWTTAQRLPSI